MGIARGEGVDESWHKLNSSQHLGLDQPPSEIVFPRHANSSKRLAATAASSSSSSSSNRDHVLLIYDCETPSPWALFQVVESLNSAAANINNGPSNDEEDHHHHHHHLLLRGERLPTQLDHKTSSSSSPYFVLRRYTKVKDLNRNDFISTIYMFDDSSYLMQLPTNSRKVHLQSYLKNSGSTTPFRFGRTGPLLIYLKIEEDAPPAPGPDIDVFCRAREALRKRMEPPRATSVQRGVMKEGAGGGMEKFEDEEEAKGEEKEDQGEDEGEDAISEEAAAQEEPLTQSFVRKTSPCDGFIAFEARNLESLIILIIYTLADPTLHMTRQWPKILF